MLVFDRCKISMSFLEKHVNDFNEWISEGEELSFERQSVMVLSTFKTGLVQDSVSGLHLIF